MSRSRKTPWFKIELCEKYLSGEGSYQDLAKKNQISYRTLREWVQKYQEHGTSCFAHSFGNTQYSKEFKIQCVEFVLSGQGTVDDSVTRFNISNRKVLRNWIKKYKAISDYIDFYNNKLLQERFGDKPPAQVRAEALAAAKPAQYPIAPNKRIQKYKARFTA